jgi:hypothetical protein
MRNKKKYGKILFSLILTEIFSSDVDEKCSYYSCWENAQKTHSVSITGNPLVKQMCDCLGHAVHAEVLPVSGLCLCPIGYVN